MVTGVNGGTNFGLGIAIIWDSRDNRYNAHSGSLLKTSFMFYNKSLGSAFQFNRFELDVRKYFNPWRKHVIAMQATTTHLCGDVPFYDLALLGGESKMRGYYKGALRDNFLIDSQVEYRLPVWKILGLVGWVGTGRVADSFKAMQLKDLWISYGGGLRIKVDSENDINMLSKVDKAIIVRHPNKPPPQIKGHSAGIVTRLIGPKGWNEAIINCIG